MRFLFSLFILTAMSSFSLAQLADYRVEFRHTLNGLAITNSATIAITGPGILNSRTKRAEAFESYSLQMSVGSLSERRFNNKQTFIDPYALSAMIEEGLNSGSVTFAEVKNELSNMNWLTEITSSKMFAKLKSPTKYRAAFVNSPSSSRSGFQIWGVLVVTGPNINDEFSGRASSLESYAIRVPFSGFTETKLRNKNFVDPFAIASLIEQALNSETIDIKEVQSFISKYGWESNALSSELMKSIFQPLEKFRVKFDVSASSGVNYHPNSNRLSNATKSAVMTITGPGILEFNSKRPSARTSSGISVPFNGFLEYGYQRNNSYVHPTAVAAMIEEALNKKLLSVDEVVNFLADPNFYLKMDDSSKVGALLGQIGSCKYVFAK